MLTRKCQETLGALCNDNEFNSRVTIAYYYKSEGAWKEHFRDSIGNLLNSNINYNFTLTTCKNSRITTITKTIVGNKILQYCWNLLSDCDGAKFEFSSNNSVRIWIIVKAFND